MICSSLNRLRFIVRLLSSDGLYPFLEEFSGLRSWMIYVAWFLRQSFEYSCGQPLGEPPVPLVIHVEVVSGEVYLIATLPLQFA
jgi:hypothetical protein